MKQYPHAPASSFSFELFSFRFHLRLDTQLLVNLSEKKITNKFDTLVRQLRVTVTLDFTFTAFCLIESTKLLYKILELHSQKIKKPRRFIRKRSNSSISFS